VAEAFLERPSPDHDEVNHRDGDKLNNQSKNLQWVTRSENIRHSVQVLGNVPLPIDNRGEKHGQSKLTDRKVRQIRKLSTTGKYTQAELAEMFGVMQSAISRIVNHKLWKHIP